MISISLFNILPDSFFKPLNSKYKATYVDCLRIIYSTYKTELSFGVDRDVLVLKLEQYFEDKDDTALIFDEDNETAISPRDKATGVLRRLRDCGWIETETVTDYKTIVNLKDYAASMIEAFNKIIKNDEIEYQSLISQIHATLLNEEAYIKPYEYIIKRVAENTEELIIGLKKLNTNIKKYIDELTSDKTANEIVTEFFEYNKNIGSKAYHRIKTSDNIAHFRISIISNLNRILSDENIFLRAVNGYMEIEMGETKDIDTAKQELRQVIYSIIKAFNNYDEIIFEIDFKHSKYLKSAVARAKFLLTNTNNAEGKINRILAYLAEQFNEDDNLNLYDEADDELLRIFSIFPQSYLNSDSIYTEKITRTVATPEPLTFSEGISKEERERRKQIQHEKNVNRFTRKNINIYVDKLLENQNSVIASSLPIDTKRDFIRLIFINLYGKHPKSIYRTLKTDQEIVNGNYRYTDFLIERR